MRPPPTVLHTEERGQTTVLILGVFTVVLMLTAVILGVTVVNAEARKLLATADGAAAAAASAAQTSGQAAPQVSEEQVRHAAEAHLEAAGVDLQHPGVQVTDAWTSDGGETVHVRLGASVELPVLRWVLPAEVPITVDSHARITLDR